MSKRLPHSLQRILVTIVFIVQLAPVLNGQDIRIFHEDKKNGALLFASNGELFPISVSLDFNLSNMVFSEGERKEFVIPPQSERYKVGELTSNSNAAYSFDYKFIWAIGDVNVRSYDKDFVYDLPFKKGQSFRINQGYKGKFSHQNENALDFVMPEGTEILAARGGLVVEVEQSNTVSCPREECKQYNNYVTIMHNDGSYARYMHIKFNGAKVNVGDQVEKSDPIAYSGSVGWSDGPHLHFVCFLGAFKMWNSLETKFRTGDGKKIEFLVEGKAYRRDY